MKSTLWQQSAAHKAPKIALIGCGAIARSYYLPALKRNAAVFENLVLSDCNRARAEELAEEFKVKNWIEDHHQVLDELDGAIIATPTDTHYPIAMELLSHGVSVLCEKPLAGSWIAANEMVQAAQATGAVLAVDYLQRLIPTFGKVRELVSTGALGEVRAIHYLVGEEFAWPTVSGFYFNSAAASRGVLRDRGAHVMDHICWWLGAKPDLVCCQTDSFGGSEAVAQVRFEYNNCVGDVKLSWLGSFPSGFEVVCDAGTICGDVYDYTNLELATPREGNKRLRFKFKSKLDIGYEIVTNFVNAIKGTEEPLIRGSDVLDSIRFIDECYRAATRFEMPWYEIKEAEYAT